MPDTAVLSVPDALALAITQGTNPPVGPSGKAILGPVRFYRGKAPAASVLGYYLLGQSSEVDAGFYSQPGQDGSYRVHCWADTPTNANRLYQWLKQLVSEKKLTLDGHTMVSGVLSKLTDQPDQTEKSWQVVAEYRVETLEG